MQMIITFFPPSPSVYPVRPKPPNPPVVTAYTSSSLTVEWTLLPGDTITAHVLQYKVSSSGQAYTDIDMDTPTDVTYTISGLLPYKEYAVRIIAVNSIGRSDPSDEVTATTGEAGMIHYGFYIVCFPFLRIIVCTGDVKVQILIRFQIFLLFTNPIFRLFMQFECIEKHMVSGISDYFRLFLTDALTPQLHLQDSIAYLQTIVGVIFQLRIS